MSSLKSKKDKTTLTNKQRKAIIEYKEKNFQITQTDLISWVKQKMSLNVHQTTISCLLKNKKTIDENLFAKRQRTVQYPELENALIEQILQSQEKNVSVDNAVIEAAISKLRGIFKKYNLKDIYNMDEIIL
ncbi:6018_t:CDS:2 [Dentiscutata erythropus]|uniref:6018_t:CDS:1 n=1 Tax=Dentiscutata erythropus TaxID=1348616 RepID=A0A9N9IJY2_9GLOM|nr:6018_t:CDS:2 [Dentiscutata erythropus]